LISKLLRGRPLITVFDYLTVACFCCLVMAFFLWTAHDTRSLLHLLISAAAFAIADQVGNSGFALFALALVVAGAGYAVLVVRGKP
jgi:hypothetical protein